MDPTVVEVLTISSTTDEDSSIIDLTNDSPQESINKYLSVARVNALKAKSTSNLNSDSYSLLWLGYKDSGPEQEQEKDDTPLQEASKMVMPILKKRR
ncbi:hypothetical protein JTB14_024098 [Gonioctena quinquepunctata]|nr:hypothetical protein JTB14_024098 [Gonioctena quinquepunctata]